MTRCRAALGVLFCNLICSSWAFAQSIVPGVQPAPLVRLTGVLEVVQEPRGSAFPVLSVWLDDRPRVFRVARVESIIPAYRAQERLREVSSLGLRFLAEGEVLTALQDAEMHDRPIVIEGWLRPRAGILQVRSVRIAEDSRDAR